MSGRLPPPTRPELLARQGARGARTLLLGGKAVGTCYPDRTVVKSFRADRHAFRKHPGVGLNVEMVCTFDQHRPAPAELVLRAGPDTLRVPWRVVREFTRQVLDLGPRSRYHLHADRDLQVLIPWEAWDGRIDTPAAPPPEQGTLL